ncbi:MAG: RagB/SusD family nutrient uptake outer membrane protein [Bacteroidales bacterium]|nr:RagB/SusD family nutrient uptake outer membrane protein [Bacteroidales bacterium]MCF8455571.1 RagB/SusD family nutrient uptake outer membrane protein [Bacteroidales bacterium]
MKKIYNKVSLTICLLVVISGVFMFNSCKKDFLEIKPQGILTEAVFLKTENDAVLATNAIYNSAREWNFYTGGYPILDILSDDANKGSNPGDGAFLNLFETFQFTPSNGDISRWYSALYKTIRRTNIVIEKVPEINMDEALKLRLVSEAKFIRAYCYFNLVVAFGDVPLVLITNPPADLDRTSKEQIYNEVIITDLQSAIDNLPEKSEYPSDDLGRATKGAARATMAKVYLYRGDFEKTATYALDVINSNEYSLEPDFSDAFSLEGQFGVESIFEIGAFPEENFTNGGNQYANTQGVRGSPNKGWGFNRPSVDLINSFEAGDLRKDATVIFLGETIDGVLIEGDVNTPDVTYTDDTETVIKEMETYNQKVWTPGITTVEEWGYNVRLIRYAEVLLFAAEALNENGNPAEALVYLNEVRTRSGLSPIASTDVNTLRELIWKERRSELAMEGSRYFDLVRQNRAEAVLGPLGFVKGKHELFPIPQNEIDISGGKLQKNPNW